MGVGIHVIANFCTSCLKYEEPKKCDCKSDYIGGGTSRLAGPLNGMTVVDAVRRLVMLLEDDQKLDDATRRWILETIVGLLKTLPGHRSTEDLDEDKRDCIFNALRTFAADMILPWNTARIILGGPERGNVAEAEDLVDASKRYPGLNVCQRYLKSLGLVGIDALDSSCVRPLKRSRTENPPLTDRFYTFHAAMGAISITDIPERDALAAVEVMMALLLEMKKTSDFKWRWDCASVCLIDSVQRMKPTTLTVVVDPGSQWPFPFAVAPFRRDKRDVPTHIDAVAKPASSKECMDCWRHECKDPTHAELGELSADIPSAFREVPAGLFESPLIASGNGLRLEEVADAVFDRLGDGAKWEEEQKLLKHHMSEKARKHQDAWLLVSKGPSGLYPIACSKMEIA